MPYLALFMTSSFALITPPTQSRMAGSEPAAKRAKVGLSTALQTQEAFAPSLQAFFEWCRRNEDCANFGELMKRMGSECEGSDPNFGRLSVDISPQSGTHDMWTGVEGHVLGLLLTCSPPGTPLLEVARRLFEMGRKKRSMRVYGPVAKFVHEHMPPRKGSYETGAQWMTLKEVRDVLGWFLFTEPKGMEDRLPHMQVDVLEGFPRMGEAHFDFLPPPTELQAK